MLSRLSAHRFERHEYRAEDQHKQKERQRKHGTDEHRQAIVDSRADNGEIHHLTTDVGMRRAPGEREG